MVNLWRELESICIYNYRCLCHKSILSQVEVLVRFPLDIYVTRGRLQERTCQGWITGVPGFAENFGPRSVECFRLGISPTWVVYIET